MLLVRNIRDRRGRVSRSQAQRLIPSRVQVAIGRPDTASNHKSPAFRQSGRREGIAKDCEGIAKLADPEPTEDLLNRCRWKSQVQHGASAFEVDF